MERVFSVDDIQGFWKLSAGMGFPRTDSEAAFQDFLKRIPSTSNLAAQAQGLDHAQQLHLQQQVQQYQHAQQAGLHAAGSSLGGGALGEVGSLNVGGIPRVPSLDLLRQLVQVNQTLSPHRPGTSLPGARFGLPCAVPVEREDAGRLRGAPASAAEMSVPKTEPEMVIPVTESMSTAMPVPLVLPQTSASLRTAGNAAAAPHMSGMPGIQQSMRSMEAASDATAGSDKETNGKAEVRRARRCACFSTDHLAHLSCEVFLLSQASQCRMLSNRESARRSRRRKQEHLSALEEEVRPACQCL